ncbi:hypothetical protein [Methanobacterium paludis]|uniref:Uncharacterized protein n=1 Tax=Methanobacterium paludis (strain DSM 25820 / JCM 18151 / SWAN1) TaxID=868131 RepID=F6D6B1_METPW|nr:hypothetical protein [Methanobacterium paludis]AEG18932.1 hypothetical protein MSWAN_1923 [Methanobacterium paludis]
MSKMLDIVMAGVISGLVAYTTAMLGVGGTIIGAVLGSMLYQLMTHIFKQPLEGVKTKRVDTKKIVYIFPLIVIVAVEILYLLASVYWKPEYLFRTLEHATGGNLFRSIGFGLIVMGIYPLLEPDNIKASYGYVLLGVGVIKLLGGFSDLNTPITNLYSMICAESGVLISLLVIAALSYVILAIAKEAVTLTNEKTINKKTVKKHTRRKIM